MSAGRPFEPLAEEDDLLAAEYALGALVGAERATAEVRERDDPAFADAVSRWRSRFSVVEPMGAVPPLWPRIADRIAANDDGAGRSARRWRAAALGLAAAACALAALLILPLLRATSPAESLVATLTGPGQVAVVSVGIEPGRGRLVIQPSALQGALSGRVAELWVVPADGRPRSLGLIDAAAPQALAARETARTLLGADATLAVSLEPPGGSPTGQPTGPVILSGKITRL